VNANIMGNYSLGIPRARSKTVRRHFTDNFSPLNFKSSVRNHVLLFLDAPGLVEEDYQRTAQAKQYDDWEPLTGGAVEFVKANAAGRISAFDSRMYALNDTIIVRSTKPVILFSHIPLGRPDTKSCGPLRERGTIRRGVGTGYQNTLGKETTTFLLETLRPSAVFRYSLLSLLHPSLAYMCLVVVIIAIIAITHMSSTHRKLTVDGN
jgi:ethanolamine phosphate phosphodiesterase